MSKIKNVLGKVLSFILSYKIYSILVILAVIGGSYYFYHRAYAGGKTTYQTTTVQKGMISSFVSGSGNLLVDQSATVNPGISGTVSKLSIKVGDKVSKGQFLFYIKNNSTSNMETTLAKAYSSYKQALQSTESARTKLLQDQQSLANLSGNLAILKATASLTQANQQLESAYANLLQARNDYNELYTKYQADPTSVTTAQLAIADEKIDVAKASYNSAKDSLKSAQATYNQEVNNVGTNLAIAKQQVVSSEATVTAAESNADSALAEYNYQLQLSEEESSKRYMTATIAGTVTEVNIKNGDEVSSSTGSASQQSASSSSSSSSSSSTSSSSSNSSSSGSILIENLDSLQASVAINETDISKVAKDQKATLTVDAISDLTLTGKVTKIAQKGTNTQDVITYDVTITIDSIDNRLRPEMTVSADITTEVKQDVLYVSSSAIKTDSNEINYVTKMENGLPQNSTTTVTIGISNDTDTEITNGLIEGDVVLTQTITSGSDNTSSTSINRSGVGIPGLGGGGAQMGR